MKKQDIALSLLFFFIGIFSRFPLIEKMHSHVDSSSLTLALIDYNFEQETPAPPGYPLYIGLAKLFMFVTHDPHRAILYVSVLFSGIGAVVFFLAGKSFSNRATGIIATMLFLSAPTFYFFGLTVYPYLVAVVMTTLIAWCVYEIAFKKKQYGILLGVLYALSLGVRPQEALTTFPLFLYGLLMMSFAQRVRSIHTFFLVLFLWLIPFLSIAGDMWGYLEHLRKAASSALPMPTLLYFLTRRFELASGFFLTFGAGIIIIAIFVLRLIFRFMKTRSFSTSEKKKVLFFAAWSIPSLLFNFFVRTEHAGYQTGYLTFFLFLLAIGIWKMFKNRMLLTVGVTLFIVVVNLFLFFYNRDPGFIRPYRQSSFHYSDIKRNDYALSNKVIYIKNNYDPKKTLIVSGPVFWRHARYYLPEYQIYEIDALVTDDPRVRDTRRDARDWKYQEYRTTNYSLRVFQPIDTLILFDDESDNWVQTAKKIKQFKGMTKLTIVPVKQGDSVRYGLGNIQVVPKNEIHP